MPLRKDCKTPRMLVLMKLIHKGTIYFVFMCFIDDHVPV